MILMIIIVTHTVRGDNSYDFPILFVWITPRPNYKTLFSDISWCIFTQYAWLLFDFEHLQYCGLIIKGLGDPKFNISYCFLSVFSWPQGQLYTLHWFLSSSSSIYHRRPWVFAFDNLAISWPILMKLEMWVGIQMGFSAP